MAFLKQFNVPLYNRLDCKRVRDKIISIRATRRTQWQEIVMPKE